jgi:hypothetical protein
MRCKRCNGLMSAETVFNCGEGASHGWLPISRCINCGYVEDATIKTNRLRPRIQATGGRACRQPRAVSVFLNGEEGGEIT